MCQSNITFASDDGPREPLSWRRGKSRSQATKTDRPRHAAECVHTQGMTLHNVFAPTRPLFAALQRSPWARSLTATRMPSPPSPPHFLGPSNHFKKLYSGNDWPVVSQSNFLKYGSMLPRPRVRAQEATLGISLHHGALLRTNMTALDISTSRNTVGGNSRTAQPHEGCASHKQNLHPHRTQRRPRRLPPGSRLILPGPRHVKRTKPKRETQFARTSQRGSRRDPVVSCYDPAT